MSDMETILVSDPDPSERGLLKRALQRGKRNVRVAATPQRTMSVLAACSPSVIVLADRRTDSACPQLAAWIRATSSTPDIPIVALVPHHDYDLMARCYESGCDLVVSTPLDIDSFCLALDALLRRTRRAVTPAKSLDVVVLDGPTRFAASE